MSALAISPSPAAIDPVWADADEQSYRAGLAVASELDEMRDTLEATKQRLAKANQILRAIRRLESKPVRCAGFDDDAAANLAVAQAETLSTIRVRIDLYFASEVRS